MPNKEVILAMNRVEGDLEVRLELDENNVVKDAKVSGSMFRGFEVLLKGRAPIDAIVFTPRICGICGTSHLYASVLAVESFYNTEIGPNGTRIRNIALMVEEIQSDLRHTFIMFAIDFCNEIYAKNKYYMIATQNFSPLKGTLYKETVHWTKELLKVIALFGGQWPHSSYMVPGGIVSVVDKRIIVDAIEKVSSFRKWYEERILGSSIEEFLEISSIEEFEDWFNKDKAHKTSGVGLFTLIGRSYGLHKISRIKPNFITFGNFPDPYLWQPEFTDEKLSNRKRAMGFYYADEDSIAYLDEKYIQEYITNSYYVGYEGGRHPSYGETIPSFLTGSDKYSYIKAPRYNNMPAETGPLAEFIIARNPLITNFFKVEGANPWLRQFARLQRPAHTLLLLQATLEEVLKNIKEPFYIHFEGEKKDGIGKGLLNAARGSLGHWMTVKDGKIERYQIITPTAWNASPMDENQKHGPMEEALIGVHISDIKNPLEVGYIIRSYDPCLVCAVHYIEKGGKIIKKQRIF